MKTPDITAHGLAAEIKGLLRIALLWFLSEFQRLGQFPLGSCSAVVIELSSSLISAPLLAAVCPESLKGY